MARLAMVARRPAMSAVARRLVRRGAGTQPVVLVGAGAADQRAVATLANELVALGVAGVATLHGGMECLLAEAAPLLVTADDDDDGADDDGPAAATSR